MTQFLLSAVASLSITFGILTAAPVPEDKPDARQAAVKEFVGKVVGAIAKQDLDALLDMSEVPWWGGTNTAVTDKAELRKVLRSGFTGKPVFEAKKYTVKRIETFKAAQATLAEMHTKAYKGVLADDDAIVHVAVEYPKGPLQVRLLVKINDGKPRLVGFDQESRE